MSNLADVTITLGDGNLGRLPENKDGVFGLLLGPCAVAPASAAVGTTAYQIRSLADAELLGITEAYDTTNSYLTWHHIKEFFIERGGSQPLWIMLYVGTTAAAFAVAADADRLMQASGGNVRMVGACNHGAPGTLTQGLPASVITSIAAAQAFVQRQFAAHKPVRVVLEGHGTTLPITYDLKAALGPNANGVAVMIGRTLNMVDAAYPALGLGQASVGRLLGRLSRIPVHYSAARVKDGRVVGVTGAGFSNGSLLSNTTDATLNTLNTLGYVFFRTIAGLPGVYFSDDPTATVVESDYARLSRCRVIDKAARIVYNVYVRELNDDVELDPISGQLSVSVVKNLEGIIESAIGTQMAGEITSVEAFIDAAQNILATDELKIEVNIVPRGIASNIKVTLAYSNPANVAA